MRSKWFALLAAVIFLGILTFINPAYAADPSGFQTLLDDPDAPVNFVWVLLSAALVFLMQGGFAMLEGGLVRVKNVGNIMMKNLMDFSSASIGYWILGFAFMFGTDMFGLIGTDGFLLAGDSYDVNVYLLWMFQVVFAGTAATIVSGAMAERTRFKTYMVFSFLITTFIYSIYGHWVWGGGWLSQLGESLGLGLGHLDFAGSGVVHMVGGAAALAGAMVLGPRIGKYDANGKPRAIPGHSVSMAILGVFLLWFGWFGFNAGSTLAATELRIAVIAVNTSLAAAAGALTAALYTWWKHGQPDVTMSGNGAIAGLVAITAPCAWVESWAAVAIGLVAGVIVVVSVRFIENRGVDDPIGAVSAHLVNGAWGLISLGIFADGTYGNYTSEAPFVVGILYDPIVGAGQLGAQLIGVAVAFLWTFTTAYIMFKILDKLMGLRVTKEEEIAGLDVFEHGITTYPSMSLFKDTPAIAAPGKATGGSSISHLNKSNPSDDHFPLK